MKVIYDKKSNQCLLKYLEYGDLFTTGNDNIYMYIYIDNSINNAVNVKTGETRYWSVEYTNVTKIDGHLVIEKD